MVLERLFRGRIRDMMVYTLDQDAYTGALISPGTPDIQALLRNHKGEQEFLGRTVFGLPLFYFEEKPPDNAILGIRWIPILEEA